MIEDEDNVGSWARVVLLAVLAFFVLGFTVPGGVVYLAVIDDWARGARGFHGIEGVIGWVFGVVAAGVISAGLILAGIFLRLLRWRCAPLASLFLAVLGAGFVIATYLVFSDTGTTPDSIEIGFLRAACLIALVLVALPPFLHWSMAGPVVAPVRTELKP